MDISDLRFFNPYAEIAKTENNLPHWQQAGATYFVTFRLADALPWKLLGPWQDEREAWLRHHPEPWTPEVEMEYHKLFSARVDRWLDASHGSCLLRRRDYAELVAGALQHFEGERCVQLSWVVMPNHVHALFITQDKQTLQSLLKSWKGWTSRQINLQEGGSGSFWQRDYFDRLVRDAAHFGNCVRYIRRNSTKAGLRQGEYLLWESELAKGIE